MPHARAGLPGAVAWGSRTAEAGIQTGVRTAAQLGVSRSLLSQICHEFTRFSARMKGVTVGNFFGGVPETQNIEALKKNVPSIVVGTPGRIKAVSRSALQ
jgi:superfamily II DNA/RNA helicase